MDVPVSETASPRAGAREWLGLAVLGLPTLLVSVDASVLLLALPHLSAQLNPTGTQMLWIVDIYAFFVAGFLITMGSLGDRIGRRRLLMIGGTAFAVASVLAAYSTGPEMLIGARALLGLAGATLMPSTLALITNMFRDARQRTLAVSVWAALFSSGLAIGPVVSGVLLEYFWWGSVFLIAVPIMALLLVCAPLLLPEYRDDDAGKLDLISVLLSLAAVVPVIYGVKELAAGGPATVSIAVSVAGLGLGYLFVRRQRMLEYPLLDLRLFADRRFSAALGVLLVGVFVISGVFLLTTQQLQLVHGLAPLQAGLWLLPSAVAMILTAMTATALVQRVRIGYVVGGSLLLTAVGCLVLTQADVSSGLWILVVGLCIVFGGAGPMMALGTDLVVGSAPPERSGSAAAMSETAQEFGVAVGIALLGSIGSLVYRAQLGGSLPAGLPADAARAAEDQLPAALAVAGRLPADMAGQVAAAAQTAFADGLNVVAGVSAAIGLVAASASLVLLRHVRSPHPDGEDVVAG
ncbi:MAG: MFS transporter [Pseudonocardia sp.]